MARVVEVFIGLIPHLFESTFPATDMSGSLSTGRPIRTEGGWILFRHPAIYLIRVPNGNLLGPEEDSIDDLHPLHVRMVHIAHLIFPGPETSPAEDIHRFQGLEEVRQGMITLMIGDGIPVLHPMLPVVDNILFFLNETG
jgi:hypothetical protein